MDQNDRLTKTKENWAKARRGGEEREVFYEGDDRLPPGQHLVETWPVLDLGQKPDIPLSEWTTDHRRHGDHSRDLDLDGLSCATAVQRQYPTFIA